MEPAKEARDCLAETPITNKHTNNFGSLWATLVSARQSLASSAGSNRGSLANPLCCGFLTPGPFQGPSLTPLASLMDDLCGTWRIRTLVFQVSRNYVINPAIAGCGHFEMHCFPQQWNDPSPRLGVTSAKNANQCDPRVRVDAESARNDLPRAPCPQDILKVRPHNSLDYRARYDTPALIHFLIGTL